MFNLFQNDLGVSIECFPENKTMGTGLFKNGFWRKITNSVGTFTYKLQDSPIDLGLTKDCEFNFEYTKNIPKIPVSIYKEIEAFFKYVQTLFKSEVYCSVVWDKENNDFFINIPKQKVSGAQVDYENEVLSNSNWVEVLQVHSHNNFDAFFSSGDDKDEIAGKLFGVIGKVNTNNPTSVWRAGFNRQTKSLDIQDVFDFNTNKIKDESNYTIDVENSIKNITERVVTTNKISSTTAKPITSLTSSRYNTSYEHDLWESNYDPYDYIYNKNVRISADDLLTKGTIFQNKVTEEFSMFLYDFNTLFQQRKTVRDQDIYNIFSSLSTLVFENIYCNSEVLNNIITEIVNVHDLCDDEDVPGDK